MFLDFYQLREQPFGVTPDPRYLYFTPGHREALASLFYGIETGRGFLSLVAEPGMGKTTLLFQLLQRWKGHMHSAFLFQTQCDSRELIRYLLDDLGLKSDGEDIVRMHSELNEFLFRETKAGRRVVLFVDEAQNLSDTVLETVRLLSDFEAPDKKLLQIVLAGQPELAQRLARPGLAQLRQRIAVQARLDPLPPSEVVRYVRHRLKVAGYAGSDLFTAEALALVAERSRGIPRLINNLCFNALSLGCAMRCKQIDSGPVREAASDLSLDSRVARPSVQPPSTASVNPVFRLPPAQSFYFWIRDNLFRGRVFQRSFLSIVFGSLAVYFGARLGSGIVQPSASTHANPAGTLATPGRESPSAGPSAGSPGDLPAQELPLTGKPENSPDSFTYVVQRRDTLSNLCVSMMGHYDDAILSKIRKLNPDLRDPNRLDIGQEIRLPLNFPPWGEDLSRSEWHSKIEKGSN